MEWRVQGLGGWAWPRVGGGRGLYLCQVESRMDFCRRHLKHFGSVLMECLRGYGGGMRGAFLRLDIFRRTFLFLFKVYDLKQGWSIVGINYILKNGPVFSH